MIRSLAVPLICRPLASPSVRRRSSRRKAPLHALLAVLSLLLGSTSLPASATNWWTPTPSLTIGAATINVRNAGALGDGVHNDTAAFQAAINALPSTGGTIVVPPGRYMIDATRSISLRSHTRLKMDVAAQLVAFPNSQSRYYVVKAWKLTDVEISGGQIVGDRVRHVGTAGEWGMGLDILASSKVYVHDLKVSDCWGDGIYVGAIGSPGSAVPSSDVTLNRVSSSNNRRQGLSFGPVARAYVVNSTFLNSNGTAPQAGIDIEPSTQGNSKDVRIEASTMTGNLGNGLELHDHVSGLVVKSSTIKRNNGFGILSVGAYKAWIAVNTIAENGLDGVAVTSTTHDVKITGNTINYNSTRWFYANNKSIYTLTSSARDLRIDSTTSGIYLASNVLSPKP
ncbi:hypothetical protein ATSB10_23560 [Dyella thiooxydans]|uniref:Pectate lyase superfamily protein domain-containing protein n=1 Tax=Dyella thiooxydans TaxID=445710 RepID=A0A160N218_9GAMM|nr:right-handed parallel beta-helix repeat-containing protein [Dyella thiooxydans]AND69810.1 hypothetical protein ATSB10_23560 [Dyella thiooxydans]